jgi:hypothetical protein
MFKSAQWMVLISSVIGMKSMRIVGDLCVHISNQSHGSSGHQHSPHRVNKTHVHL